MAPQVELEAPVQAWLVSVFGDERQYAGNTGYKDELDRVYHYDNFVQNHLQVCSGDLLVFRDRRKLLGAAPVLEILSTPGTKDRLLCPTCGDKRLSIRKTKTPRYRCINGHECHVPRHVPENCTRFEARYDGHFLPAIDLLPAERLKNACMKYADQLSMQRLDLGLIKGDLCDAIPGLRVHLAGRSPRSAVSTEATDNAYAPSGSDDRTTRLAAVSLRQGQPAFRAALRARYGDECMVSGCRLIDVLEAAHICPYRGANDNHPENGLLLRADLHVLFDLDLLGVEPASLHVHLHPRVASSGYEALAGSVLRCSPFKPSNEALATRWKAFQARREDQSVWSR